MTQLASALREEISRLSRKAMRGHIDSTKKATAQHRRHIAALKRQVADLERRVATLLRRAGDGSTPPPGRISARATRFVPKGLRSHRTRLGLSASEYGRLAGVSAQTIYNWERGLAHPGKSQFERLVGLRDVGKREAGRRLQAMESAKPKRGR